MNRHLFQETKAEIALLRKTHIHEHRNLGERVADNVAGAIGSWRFIIVQTLIVLLWCALNVAGWFVWHWDPYPFILLNLGFSTQAAYTGPILLLASNRQSQKDRQRDDLEAGEVAEMLMINRNQVQHDDWTREFLNAFAAYMLNPTKESEKSLKELL